MAKYVFFQEYYYKPMCIGHYNDDEIAMEEAQKLADEKGVEILVVRHLTQRAPGRAATQPPKVDTVKSGDTHNESNPS